MSKLFRYYLKLYKKMLLRILQLMIMSSNYKVTKNGVVNVKRILHYLFWCIHTYLALSCSILSTSSIKLNYVTDNANNIPHAQYTQSTTEVSDKQHRHSLSSFSV